MGAWRQASAEKIRSKLGNKAKATLDLQDPLVSMRLIAPSSPNEGASVQDGAEIVSRKLGPI